MRQANFVNLWLNIILGVVLGVTGQLLMGGFSLLSFLQTLCLTIGVGFFAGTWVPVNALGNAAAKFCRCHSRVTEYLVSSFAIAVVMTLLISIVSVFIQTGTAFLPILKRLLPAFLPVGALTVMSTLWKVGEIAARKYPEEK